MQMPLISLMKEIEHALWSTKINPIIRHRGHPRTLCRNTQPIRAAVKLTLLFLILGPHPEPQHFKYDDANYLSLLPGFRCDTPPILDKAENLTRPQPPFGLFPDELERHRGEPAPVLASYAEETQVSSSNNNNNNSN